jgi:hypothetical protein
VTHLSDTYTVRGGGEKRVHPWGQPLAPWRYWLGRLTVAGDLVADPFAGGATVGRALKEVGGSRHLGTEIDGETVLVRNRPAIGPPGETEETRVTPIELTREQRRTRRSCWSC